MESVFTPKRLCNRDSGTVWNPSDEDAKLDVKEEETDDISPQTEESKLQQTILARCPYSTRLMSVKLFERVSDIWPQSFNMFDLWLLRRNWYSDLKCSLF